jgi:secreted trypsin-like serine protease
MSRWTTRLATLGVVGALLSTFALSVSAASSNPLRDHVKRFETRFLAKHGITPPKASVSPMIIGGTVAPEGKWPGLVGMLYAAEPDDFLAQYCGGSLISPTHVLTAAHCADFVTPGDIEVLVGSQHLDGTGTRVAVSAVTVHPSWDSDLLNNDVAVITLATPVTTIKPVKFISSLAEEALYAPAGTRAMAAGWGYTELGWVTDVMQAPLPVVDHASCVAGYAAWGITVTDQMLCAGKPAHKQSVCNGDSGSPLWVKNADGRYKLQAGVVSWGISGCAYPGAPDAFARLAVLGPWVKAQMAPPSVK